MFLSSLVPSRFFPLLPQQAFLLLDNEPSLLSYLPFSYFLDGGHDPLDVIFRPAPGLRSDRPARHCRGGKIFLKLTGSSDTMQTVQRTEEPVRLRGLQATRREVLRLRSEQTR